MKQHVYFPIQITDVSKSESSAVPIKETLYKNEEITVIQNDILADIGHFTTDGNI